MQKNNKACTQFIENHLTDDEEETEFNKKNSPRALPRRLMERAISTSSDSSSAQSIRSLSNSSMKTLF